MTLMINVLKFVESLPTSQAHCLTQDTPAWEEQSATKSLFGSAVNNTTNAVALCP